MSVQTQQEFKHNSLEEAGYFPAAGAHLYTVLHGVADPIARVLLVGPFASERHYSYIPWIRWARYLADHNVECVRYDYRGTGESTGDFEQMSFAQWLEDVRLLAEWLKGRGDGVPLLLHGLELGSVLAGKTFDAGIGDMLLLWAPSKNANQALRSTLLRRISMDHAFKFGDERRPPSSYIELLENGESLEVEGYCWTAQQWRDSFNVQLPVELENGTGIADGRLVRSVKLDRASTPLVKGSSVGYEAVSKDFSALFAENLEWIQGAAKRVAPKCAAMKCAGGIDAHSH